jgi:hypothetical protein
MPGFVKVVRHLELYEKNFLVALFDRVMVPVNGDSHDPSSLLEKESPV